jgi:hypothetical protein
MAASMAARCHRPATAAPNRGQAGASHAPPPERAANSTSTSGESRSMEFVDEPANPRHGRACA